MPVSVSMPQLGESVSEGTVTRWLKKEGERVERDEPLLEISTDKVDTEIPSPAAGILRSITVAEDETVAVGAELATIDDSEGAEPGIAAQAAPSADGAGPVTGQDGSAEAAAAAPAPAAQASAPPAPAPAPAQPASFRAGAPPYQSGVPPYQASTTQSRVGAGPSQAGAVPPRAAPPAVSSGAAPYQTAPFGGITAGASQQATPTPQAGSPPTPPPSVEHAGQQQAGPGGEPDAGPESLALPSGPDGPYVTPLVRKLASEHSVDLAEISGTGVGGRIRKQDVLDAARARRGAADAAPARQFPGTAAPPGQGFAPGTAGQVAPGAYAPSDTGALAAAAQARPHVVPSSLRGTTERISRLRQVIAQRMVESLQTSAQLTTVVEADVTAIARLRERAKAEFEARESVRLTFLPFFALAALEALKVHPKLNAELDAQAGQVTYHDAEHLGVAVDTDRGLLVPVIRNAGDLNIGGLARKIADLAHRTRSGQVSPDELTGGTFTLTNTGSRGALFDTPIINQPQVAILGTGTVVKRPVVVEDPTLGEVIAVRSIVYLALTYDHRLIDGADAARFLTTVRNRLEEGSFEAELGL
jgi:2-oxoglutarate dehydrogenase E2 component (dihydrolipoamide succinyltransferase)